MIMQPDIDECGLEPIVSIPAPKLEYNTPGVIYVAFQKAADDYPIGMYICALSNTRQIS